MFAFVLRMERMFSCSGKFTCHLPCCYVLSLLHVICFVMAPAADASRRVLPGQTIIFTSGTDSSQLLWIALNVKINNNTNIVIKDQV